MLGLCGRAEGRLDPQKPPSKWTQHFGGKVWICDFGISYNLKTIRAVRVYGCCLLAGLRPPSYGPEPIQETSSKVCCSYNNKTCGRFQIVWQANSSDFLTIGPPANFFPGSAPVAVEQQYINLASHSLIRSD